MNILYFCNVNCSLPLETGVYKKVQSQCKVLRMDGHDVKLGCFEGENKFVVLNKDNSIVLEIDVSNLKNYARDRYVFSEVKRYILNNSVKCIYTRYSRYSLDSYKFYNDLKKQNVDIILEIPTYPMSQRWSSFSQSLKNKKYSVAIKQLINNTYGAFGIYFFKRCISRIVNNNGFNEIWGIPVIQIQNGIDVNSIPKRTHSYICKDSITIMTVANINPWHGFDRLIKGLHEYYQLQPNIQVTFEIVGPGAEVDFLRALAKNMNVDKYVTFHGVVVGKDLDEIFERADIGVAILGIHRNNMSIIDCLKSREFCARKLPFITQDAEVHFKDKRFALSVPSNETPINIKDVIKLYESVCFNLDILDEMYDFAKEKCDWTYTFKNVREYYLTKEQL